MKRLVVALVAVCMIGSVAVLISGCGQTTPQIKTEVSTVPQPKGLTIRGTVYGEGLSGNLKNPLAGVVLTLNGGAVTADGRATYTRVTTSDANGGYVFTDLPQSASSINFTSASIKATYNINSGNTIVAVKDGYQKQINYNISLTNGTGSNPLPDNSEINVDIVMTSNPVILSMSPMPGTTVEAAANTIAVNFNEAMDKSTIRPTLSCKGMRGYSSIGDTQTLTTTWSADSKTLYITTGPLLQNKEYQLLVDPNQIGRDIDGFALDNSGGVYDGGLASSIYNGSDAEEGNYHYRTASGGAPGAPTGVLLTVNGTTSIDVWDVAFGESVDLSWIAPQSGNVSGYKVYVSNSASGPWQLLDDPTTQNSFSSDTNTINVVLYGLNWAQYNASCIKQMAFVTDPTYFKVAAFNAEGETASAAVHMRDNVKPKIVSASLDPVNGWNSNYSVPSALRASLTDFGNVSTYEGCYLFFYEPMDPATLSDASKYTVSTGQTVTAATLVYNSPMSYCVQLTFNASIEPGESMVTVEASSTGPKDISGNIMDTEINGITHYPGNSLFIDGPR